MEAKINSTAIPDTGDGGGADNTASIMRYIVVAIGCLGMLTNSFVIAVAITHAPLRRRVSHLFIIHQTVADLVSSVLLVTSYVSNIVSPTLSGVGGEILCRLIQNEALLWIAYNASTYNLVSLTVERYLMIVHPIIHRNHVTRKKAFCVMGGCWLFSASHNAFFSIHTTAVVDGACQMLAFWYNDDEAKAYGIVVFLVPYLGPLLIVCFSYTHLVIVIRNKIKNAVRSIVKTEKKDPDDQLSRAQINITKTLVLVTVAFAVCWTPTSVHFLMINLGYPGLSYDDALYYSFMLLSLFTTFINPVIYSAKFEEFQVGARKLLRLKSPRVSHGSTDGS